MGSITNSPGITAFFATGDKYESDPEDWTYWNLLPPRSPPTYMHVLIVGAGFAGPVTLDEVVLFLVYICSPNKGAVS